MPAQNRFIGSMTSPPDVVTGPSRSCPCRNWNRPNTAAADSTPVTIRPWYRAPMMFWLLPRRTKKAPMIEVTMQTAQISSGSSIMTSTYGWPRKKMAARTMVATVVTA